MYFHRVKSNMICALKVDTYYDGWFQTIFKILRKIKGKVDSQKFLRMIAQNEKTVEVCWITVWSNTAVTTTKIA
ncbi:hypothetical protein MTR_1g021540 [Medicago truncatula]|uniref:Uncharacterized protein n=1 Tax=Medicago truncatula TaxID=3880 RepID=A0A072VDH0_MEDTR|nr:hypothetical protein MTR_1g021540 [Medicago truncatula]